jgi:hypothetical protein
MQANQIQSHMQGFMQGGGMGGPANMHPGIRGQIPGGMSNMHGGMGSMMQPNQMQMYEMQQQMLMQQQAYSQSSQSNTTKVETANIVNENETRHNSPPQAEESWDDFLNSPVEPAIRPAKRKDDGK